MQPRKAPGQCAALALPGTVVVLGNWCSATTITAERTSLESTTPRVSISAMRRHGSEGFPWVFTTPQWTSTSCVAVPTVAVLASLCDSSRAWTQWVLMLRECSPCGGLRLQRAFCRERSQLHSEGVLAVRPIVLADALADWRACRRCGPFAGPSHLCNIRAGGALVLLCLGHVRKGGTLRVDPCVRKSSFWRARGVFWAGNLRF